MDDSDTFIELVNNICRRPRMFTLNGTFGEVAAVLTGIQIASPNSPISEVDQKTFSSFVTSRLLVPSKYSWPGAIRMVADDDETAISRLHELLIEFVTLRKTKSLDEIRELAARTQDEYSETEPAKLWRQFLAARYSANRAEIEPLIMPNPDAAVLWRGQPTPSGVAAQLNSIWTRISCLSFRVLSIRARCHSPQRSVSSMRISSMGSGELMQLHLSKATSRGMHNNKMHRSCRPG